MALNTDYTYNVDLKHARITFYDDGFELAYFDFDTNVVTISSAIEFSVVPTWGTNKDIKEWFNLVESMRGRMGIVDGKIRTGYEYSMEIKHGGVHPHAGVDGKLKVNNIVVADWEWRSETNALTLAERVEQAINFAELRSFVQWMLHFQYCVRNFGG